MKAELFLALRYLKPKRSEVSLIAVLSVLGVTLGVTVLIVVLAVMTGFIDLFKSKLIETQAHLQVYRQRAYIEDPAPILQKMSQNGISGAGVILQQALLQERKRFVPKMVLGIDPAAMAKHYDLEKIKRDGTFDLEPGEILISSRMAAELNLYIGSRVLLHSPRKLSSLVEVGDDGQVRIAEKGEVFLPKEFRVAGMFSFGKYDFDSQFIFMSMDDAAELYDMPWGSATMIYGWVDDPFHMNAELNGLQQALASPDDFYDPLLVSSWEENNQTMLSVLNVEKNMMFFLLIFIILVAAFSITNTLITTVYQKTREIGVLKTLGSSNAQVMRIFIWQGFFVGVLGAILGVTSGCLLVAYRNSVLRLLRSTGRDPFPAEFYVFNELPAHLAWQDVMLVAACAVVLCTVSALLPAWRAARLDPAKALRYE